MTRDPVRKFRRPAAQFLLGCIGLGLLTLLYVRLELNLAITAFSYLILIVLLSLMGSFVASIALAVVAAACLSHFFAPPLFDFRVDDPFDVALVIAFVVTSLVVTGLIARTRKLREVALAAEESTREREAELQQLIDVVPQLIFVLDAEGRRLYASRSVLDYHGQGFSLDAFREGSAFAAYTHPEDVEKIVRERQRGLSSGIAFECEGRMRRGDGQYRWFLFRYNPLRDHSGRILRWYGTATDIDDRKVTEDAFRRSEAYLAEAQRVSRAGSFAWNVGRGEYVYWSAELYRIFRRDPAEGVPAFQSFQDEAHPDWPAVVEARDRAVRENTDQMCDIRLIFPDDECRYVRMVTHPIVDDSGGVVELIGTAMDITAAKCAEDRLRQAQADLAHVTRVSTLGQLTASIAHEVSQPLAAIVTNGEACLRWLDQEPPVVEEARSAVSGMIDDGMRATEVIRQLRALSKKTQPHKIALAINDVIDGVILLVQRELLVHHVVLRTELAAALPPVLGDKVQLQQVIINLMMNAMEAMDDSTGRARELVVRSRRHDADRVLVAVQDSGIGIDPKNIERLFTPFFTTKSAGIGMGLSICRSIIEAHGGRLWASPNAGLGATLQFTLPVG